MINTVIFDVGMVLARFRWKEYLEEFKWSEEIKEKVAKATVLSTTWNQFDKGSMTWQELYDEFCSNDETVKNEITLFFKNLENIVQMYADSVEWVKSVKESGYRVYILSNYPEYLYEKSQKELRFLEYVDGAVFSFREKTVKPEPEIYQCLLERYSIHPNEAVFLDDVAINLEAAKKHGIHTILVSDREVAQAELQKMLKKVKKSVDI